jgi:SAM-dependent methyltransferase
MLVDRLWNAARPFVPVRLYPALAPLHRWRRRMRLDRLRQDDVHRLHGDPGLIAPPAELRYNVVGNCTIPEFLAGGEQAVRDIEQALGSIGRSLDDTKALLDFGCGCGRVLLALERRTAIPSLTGCDVDERSIEWCQQNLRRSRCFVNGALPPLPVEPGSFDLIWCGSVFTHLDEDRQDRWLEELHRILTPGGILLASVHGRACWEPRLSTKAIATLKRQGMMFARFDTDIGFRPRWYQVAWHTEEYVKTHWGSRFRIAGYIPRGLQAHQDLVVAEKSLLRNFPRDPAQ